MFHFKPQNKRQELLKFINTIQLCNLFQTHND
ncbi:MAG: hypothetical protein Athens071426_393 [Parcubacteria group bacterium Athens0714_26]|nr:MAG: hypothetical protein Athens071426_393 [Parcubacteria group bacterium Athens0714_26]